MKNIEEYAQKIPVYMDNACVHILEFAESKDVQSNRARFDQSSLYGIGVQEKTYISIINTYGILSFHIRLKREAPTHIQIIFSPNATCGRKKTKNTIEVSRRNPKL